MQEIYGKNLKQSVIRLSGGIGNQLFQYAFSTFIEKQYGIATKLDLDSYSFSNGSDDRYPLVHKLNIEIKKFTESTYILNEAPKSTPYFHRNKSIKMMFDEGLFLSNIITVFTH